MSFAIGLRFYRIAMHIRQDGSEVKSPVPDLYEFFADFMARKTDPIVVAEATRTWYMDPRPYEGTRAVHGYIKYGTHGFESTFTDVNTRQEQFQRKATDVEIIPLYFQVWSPEGSQIALIAFQSFTGRSCITHVRPAMIAEFSEAHPEYSLSFSIVTPAAALMDDAPVKTVTFWRPMVSADKADKYLLGHSIEDVDYEVTLRARRRSGMISTYGELTKRFDDPSGLITFADQQFENVRAKVRIGRKQRSVGVYGQGSEVGLIDVTDDVVRADNGHPTWDSMVSLVDGLMDEFFHGMN
ncbi:MAG TPA: hypothetical protein VNQ99_17800 [Xanthobacteraceae bacterium]|nr:hypothetical protein [Xanthobacteraceae bacterium]